MSLLDKILPVVPWEVTVNGQFIGIYHARTRRGAMKYVTVSVKEIPAPDPILPIIKSVEDEYTAELAKIDLFIKDNRLADEYRKAIEEGLAWNMANPIMLSNWYIIEVTYEKTAKGKTRSETSDIGVAWHGPALVKELKERELKTNQGIVIKDITCRQPYMNWRNCGRVVDDKYYEEKYGVLDLEKALKKVKAL